jgi:hypothetical protein
VHARCSKVSIQQTSIDVGPVHRPPSVDLAIAAVLFLAPHIRHFFVESRFKDLVKLIDVHRTDSIVQALVLSLESIDSLLMLAPWTGVVVACSASDTPSRTSS